MNNAFAVFFFEWRRALTPARMLWWIVLAVFPMAIILLMIPGVEFLAQQAPPGVDPELRVRQIQQLWSFVIYLLCPGVTSMLGVFLTSAPAVASELEQRSWVYLSTRPRGAQAVVVGKYMVSLTWGYSAAQTATILAVLASPLITPWESGIKMSVLCLLSCAAYSAAYLLIGVVFSKRAMVFCVGWTVLAEIILSLVPALVNELTIQHRLASLFASWTDLKEYQEVRNNPFLSNVLGKHSPATEIVMLVLTTAGLLWLATVIVQRREFTSVHESDV